MKILIQISNLYSGPHVLVIGTSSNSSKIGFLLQWKLLKHPLENISSNSLTENVKQKNGVVKKNKLKTIHLFLS